MKLKSTFFLLLFALSITAVFAQKYKNQENVVVTKNYSGTEFSSEKSLSQIVENSNAFAYLKKKDTEATSTLASLLNDSQGNKMVTVFLPTNTAYDSLSEADRNALSSNKMAFKNVLKSHIVPGRIDAYAMRKTIQSNGGLATFTTLSGEQLRAKIVGDTIVLMDDNDATATIIATDYLHANGFVHMVDTVLFSEEKQ